MTPHAQLESRLERELLERLGLRTDAIVRSTGEWTKVVAGNPFVAEAERDPSHLVVVFLKRAPAAGALGVRGTARNWNTVRKLHELGPEAAGPTPRRA